MYGKALVLSRVRRHLIEFHDEDVNDIPRWFPITFMLEYHSAGHLFSRRDTTRVSSPLRLTLDRDLG